MTLPAMSADVDHYGMLGISSAASQDEVKKAYRALSKLYHPDKTAHLDESKRREREAQMVRLNVAYQVLSSPRQRREHDLSRPSATPSTCSSSSSVTPRARGFASASGVPAGYRSQFSANPSSAAAEAAAAAAQSKPRYQYGSKYTQRSRQARRMDPSQYTTHIDGRASEFSGRPPMPSMPGSASSTSSARPASRIDLDDDRNLPWVQRELDLAREWEKAYCPEPPETERYQWRKATDGLLRNLREKRQQRCQEEGRLKEDWMPSATAAA
eukprot:TRINITY_DN12715_c2_g1_i1.p1 TRINITY_DN12715_c2_g1~~TRINITY_DN12715_c2_g1_i1.p1  ORF type:complete len:270 (-),score=60.64 TRINITY_DN12715_c2_g1_i1:65-874(-)